MSRLEHITPKQAKAAWQQAKPTEDLFAKRTAEIKRLEAETREWRCDYAQQQLDRDIEARNRAMERDGILMKRA